MFAYSHPFIDAFMAIVTLGLLYSMNQRILPDVPETIAHEFFWWEEVKMWSSIRLQHESRRHSNRRSFMEFLRFGMLLYIIMTLVEQKEEAS